ncbi:MAG TPA: DUF6159 family protein [Streptosporangiaceae bacterium]
MADKAMVGLLLAGGFAAAAVLALVMYPAWPFGHIAPSVSGGGLAGLLVLTGGLWASSLVIRFVTGAVVGAAVIRADGRSPSVRAALAVAWSRRWQLAAWALVSAVIAVLLGKLQRFGIAGVAARFVAGIGWAAATMFAVPLVISEGTMPPFRDHCAAESRRGSAQPGPPGCPVDRRGDRRHARRVRRVYRPDRGRPRGRAHGCSPRSGRWRGVRRIREAKQNQLRHDRTR